MAVLISAIGLVSIHVFSMGLIVFGRPSFCQLDMEREVPLTGFEPVF